MDVRQLIPKDYRDYFAQFNRKEYAGAFQRYSELAQPVFTALTEGEAAEAAGKLVDHCGTLLRPLRRGTMLFDLQQLFALYTVPAAGAFGGAAAEFARQLAEQWGRQYPRFVFQMGTYEGLMKGFPAHRILGIDINWGKKDGE